jgi:nicotinamide-nucleotide amidase
MQHKLLNTVMSLNDALMPDLDLLQCGQLLRGKELSIAFAESATAGRITSEFSLIPDAGKFLKGAFICYDACLKENVLGVSGDFIKKYTPESAEVTEAIAKGLSRVIPADIHIGITGLTTPGGSETPEKPVGTMFIHGVVRGSTSIFSERQVFGGTPEEIILQTVHATVKLLNNYLKILGDAW